MPPREDAKSTILREYQLRRHRFEFRKGDQALCKQPNGDIIMRRMVVEETETPEGEVEL